MGSPAVARKLGAAPDAVDMIIEQWRHERPDMNVSALAVFGRLSRSYQRYQAQIGAMFEEHGINVAAFDVLATLRRSGDPFRLTAGELAQQTLVTTGGLTMRVDRLKAAGLVCRERDAADRRVVYVRLTDAGHRLIDVVAERHFDNEQRLLVALSDTDRRRLAALLGLLERSLELAELTAGVEAG